MKLIDRAEQVSQKAWDRLSHLSLPTLLALTAISSSVLTAGLFLGFRSHRRIRRSKDIKAELQRALSGAQKGSEGSSTRSDTFEILPSGVLSPTHRGALSPTLAPLNLGSNELDKEMEEELFREQLSRNYAFLGDEAMSRVRNSFVIVVGAGGVGSWAANMLVRSGVQRIRAIDFDQVTLSSLNRHAVATRSDVGTSKVKALKKHLSRIVPQAKVETCTEMYTAKAAERLLGGNPDYVLDCIDNIDTKVHLLHYCHTNNIPCISSMGAGAKCDPSRIQIADISDTFEDPLARAVRRRLKKVGVLSGIETVYSMEKPSDHVGLVPLDETRARDADEYAIAPDFRSRIMPVLGPLPAMFGMAMADLALCRLAQHPLRPLAAKGRDVVYQRILRDLQVREAREFGRAFEGAGALHLGVEDVAFLVEEVFESRSAISGQMEKLTLIRWDLSQPASLRNIIVLCRKECTQHVKQGGKQGWDASVQSYVQERMVQLDRWEKLRGL